MRGSPRLAAAWALWCVLLSAALWAGCALPVVVRLTACAGLALALWRGVLAFLRPAAALRPVPAAGASLVWEADGRWRLQPAGGRPSYVQPQAPRRLGPFLWLRWRDASGSQALFLDLGRMEPKSLAALKARMKVSRASGHARSP